MTHVIKGEVLNEATEEGIERTRVQVFDVTQEFSDFLAETTTDNSGQFEIRFEESEFREWFSEDIPDLFFRVYLGDRLVADTRGETHWSTEADAADVTIWVPGVDDALYRVTVPTPVVVFDEPSEDAKRTVKCDPRDELDVLEKRGDWYNVRTAREEEGWVSGDSLSVLDEVVASLSRPVSESVVDSSKVDALYDFIENNPYMTEPERDEYRSGVDRAVADTTLIEELAADGLTAVRGNLSAESRLITTLDFLVRSESRAARPRPTRPRGISVAESEQPSGEQDYPRPEPSSDVPRTIGSSSPIATLVIAIVQYVRRVEPDNPAAFETLLRRYIRAVGTELRTVERLELLYGAYLDVHNGRKPFPYFRLIFDLIGRDRPAFENTSVRIGPQSDSDMRTDGGEIPVFIPDLGEIITDELDLDMSELLDTPFVPSVRPPRTFDPLECLCGEAYEITNIVNLDRDQFDGSPYVHEGCPGDLVEIQGRGFGAERDWELVDGNSEVIFLKGFGPDSTGPDEEVPVAEAEYESWSDTSVRVRVPDGAESGQIAMRILCPNRVGGRPVDVSRCGIVLRFVTGPMENRRFDIPTEPIIKRAEWGSTLFLSDRPTRQPTTYRQAWTDGDETPELMACSRIFFHFQATDVESVVITDGDGNEIDFPAGTPGERRTIDTSSSGPVVDQRERRETETYTMRVHNICSTVERTLTVNRAVGIGIGVNIPTFRGVSDSVLRNARNEPDIPAGEAFNMRLEHACSPRSLGIGTGAVKFSARDPESLLRGFPKTYQIQTDERGQINVDGFEAESGKSAMVRIQADITENREEYDPARITDFIDVAVYDTPQITDVKVLSGDLQDGDLEFTITGDYLSPRPRSSTSDQKLLNNVKLQYDYGTGPRTILSNRSGRLGNSEIDVGEYRPGPDPEKPWLGGTIQCRILTTSRSVARYIYTDKTNWYIEVSHHERTSTIRLFGDTKTPVPAPAPVPEQSSFVTLKRASTPPVPGGRSSTYSSDESGVTAAESPSRVPIITEVIYPSGRQFSLRFLEHTDRFSNEAEVTNIAVGSALSDFNGRELWGQWRAEFNLPEGHDEILMPLPERFTIQVKFRWESR